MEQIQHFSHEHPLMFSSQETKDDDDSADDSSDEKINRVCRGCALAIITGSDFYTCEECHHQFSLHKTCAELPRKLEHHHMHPHHPLVLHPRSPNHPCDCLCSSCGIWTLDNFIYHCSQCQFDLDIICASSDQINAVQHSSHPQHHLVLLGRPTLLLCDACGEEHKGHFYMCNSCRFYIHQECASLPSTLMCSHHPAHSLTLSYFLPTDMSWMQSSKCNICRGPCRPQHWRYYCRRCRYVVHVRCPISRSQPIQLRRVRRHNFARGDDEYPTFSNVIRLPPANEFVSVVGHITNSTTHVYPFGLLERQEVQAPQPLIEVNHLIGHEHPLAFLEDESGGSNASTIRSFLFGPDSNSFSHAPNCDVCFRAVSPPFYCCKTCNLFLHEKCSKLPSKIDQHPYHREHPLILLPNSPKILSFFRCELCGSFSNGICFHCPTCQISLDVKCALLTVYITHEAHPHHFLTLSDYDDPAKCNCCQNFSMGCKFVCGTCDFALHCDCALFPSTAHDIYDKHDLKLIYDPAQGNSDEYYCQICEREIDQRYWFYHCNECDISFHIQCDPPEDHIRFRITGFPSLGYHNLKLGRIVNSNCHPHPLTFTQHLEGSLCNICGRGFHVFYGYAFECSECNFVIHYHCCGLDLFLIRPQMLEQELPTPLRPSWRSRFG